MRRGLAFLAALGAGLALSACAHAPLAPKPTTTPPSPPPVAEVAPRVVRVRVPTPVKCVPEDLGAPPAYPDNDRALRDAGGAADRYQLLAAGRLLREERLKKLEDVVKKCRSAGR